MPAPGKLQRKCTAATVHGSRILQMILCKAMPHISSVRSSLSSFLFLLSTRRRLSFPQLIITLFYCPTGLAAYILFCRFFVVLLYFNLYIAIPAIYSILQDYTFYCSLGLPFTPLHFSKLAGSSSLILLYTFSATNSILHDQRPSCLHQRTR